jgi:DNA repair protein RecN (Recombination protein N)
MLLELRIRNFAVIEEAALEFGPGLNVLTGETGAGKTIILSALGLLLGARASPDMVRAETREAVVEARFEIEGETPIPGLADPSSDHGEVLVRRVVAEGGRSRVTVDDALATVQTLSKLGAALVQVYGQHEQQSLLRAESHQEILDRYAGLEPALVRYRAIHERANVLRAKLDELARRERERADLLELARFRAAEIAGAALVAGEDEALAKERIVLANAARLAAAAHDSEQMLYGGEVAALDILARAKALVSEAAALDAALGAPLEMLEAARANVEEAAHALRRYAGRVEADPARLERVEARLQELSQLKRKYGGSLDAALKTLEKSRAEIAELENVAESRAGTEAELDRALDELVDAARRLSAARMRAAADLKRRTEAELRTLGMRNPVFEARLSPLAEGDAAGFKRDGVVLGPEGIDEVEFYLSPNLGQPPMALARIASGGELSRVMLALKRLEAQRRGVATMIFDEVDAGIGGEVAQVVGRKLRQLARYHQVLCVTHLAQIAAFAERHFQVEKVELRGATRSRVRMLADGERAEEIARMLGGASVSEKFRRAARELLERAREQTSR